MKWLIRIVLFLLVFSAIAALAIYFWLKSSAPQYDGSLSLQGLHQPVDVYYDDYGVPHIYAQNKADLYKAFGYVHAQDRLFQMEMLRRAGSGRLAEIIGKPLLKVDRMFLSLGLKEYAASSAAYFETLKGSPVHDDVMAYLDGINQFIAQGDTPPEFSIIGIEKSPFGIEDLYYITGAMSFSFSQAQKTEPVVDFIAKTYGDAYLKDMGLWHESHESFIRTDTSNKTAPVQDHSTKLVEPIASDGNDASLMMAEAMNTIEQLLPVAPLYGSNAWVVGPQKTENGEVLFCNDTHIGYLLPQTWYEAHLNAPDFEIYGHFMSGIPFALVGRNRQLSWGLTMLLNDDMDFYRETPDSLDKAKFRFGAESESFSSISHTIHIKGEPDTTIEVRYTRHGPLINDAFEGMKDGDPISMYWTYTKLPNRNIDALYGLNNATDLAGFESHLSKIHAPGLSVNYGDKSGNVAWWGCASLLRRPAQVNSWTILDGSDPSNDPLGFYPFSSNPKCINPQWGYIYSANDWPEAITYKDVTATSDKEEALWYPGYYKPQYRADRINKLLRSRNDWTMESIKSVMTDHNSDADSTLMASWFEALREVSGFRDNADFHPYEVLFNWSGTYDPISCQATFFNHMLYHVLHSAMADELGERRFDLFMQTHQYQRTQVLLDRHKESPWWDDIRTDSTEKRQDVLFTAYCKTIEELKQKYGSNPKVWNWRKAATLELKHPLGEVAVFRPFFNIGPETVYGGNETILQSGFKMDSTGEYKVYFGSQMRIIVDFANVDSALNITPAGQSGHIMSPHYKDQAEMYRTMQFRVQWMNREVISKMQHLQFIP